MAAFHAPESGPPAGRSAVKSRRWVGLVRAIGIALGSAFVLVLVAVGSLSLLFARGNPRLSAQLLAALNDAVGSDSTRIVCDGVRGDLFDAAIVDRPRLLVRTPEGEVVWAESRRLRVEYDLLELLLQRNRALRFAIDRPEIHLVHDARGNLVVPRFASRRTRRPSGAVTRIDVTIRDGVFSLDRGGFRFGSIKGRAVARLASAGSTVDLRQLEGSSAMPGRPGILRVSGNAAIEGGRLRVDPLRVALSRTRIAARIDWDLARARVASSSADLAPFDVGEVMRLFDTGIELPGTLRGSVAFAGDPVSGSARCRLEGTVRGEPVDTLIARATLEPGAVRIDDVRIRVRQAELVGQARFETRGAMFADFAVRDVNPALLPWWRMPERTPQGSLSGRARLRARRARPRPAAELTFDFAPSRLGRVRIAGGRAELRRLPDGAVEVDSVALDVPGGRISGSGRLGADSTIQLSVVAAVRDLGAMDSLLAPLVGESGTGRVTGILSGSLAHPDFRGEARLSEGRLDNGLGFDSLEVAARGRLGEGGAGEADVHILGFRSGSRILGSLDARAAWDRIVRIERFRLASGDTVLTLRGSVRPSDRGVTVSLDSVAIGTDRVIWRNRSPVEASLAGDHLRVTRVSLAHGHGSLDLSGEAHLRGGAIDVRGTLANVDLAAALGREDSTARLRGRLGAEFTVRGGLTDPEVDMRLEAGAPGVHGFEGDSLEAVLHYAAGRLEIDRAVWTDGPGRVALSGSVRSGMTLERWIRAVKGESRGWTDSTRLELTIQGDSLELEHLAPLGTSLRSLSGFASFRGSVGGTAANPRLGIRARGSRLAYRSVGIESADLEGEYEGRRLRIRKLALRQGNAASVLEGELPVDLSYGARKRWLADEPLRLSARMPEADFSVASLFVPHIASSAGRMSLSADVNGSPREPKISGTVRLEGGRVRFAGRAEILEDLAVDGTLDAERLTITRFSAKEGKKGRLSGTGYWRWRQSGRPGGYEFQIKASDCVMTDQENYEVRFGGSFTVQDARRPDGSSVPRVTGAAIVTRGDLTLDLSKPPAEPPQPLPFLYEVTADVSRNLWYLNLDAEMELGGPPLVLKNDGAGDLIRGQLEVLRGKYSYLYTDWRIMRGEIRFTRLDRIDPEMDIVAVTNVQSPGGGRRGERELEPIYLSITGNASAPKLRLYDDQGSSPSYLFKVLSVGQFSATAGEESPGGGVSGEAIGPDLALPIKNYLFRNAERVLSEARIIDTIDLRTGEATAGSAASGAKAIGGVGVGKYVTPELYVRYSREFSSSLEQRIAAEYRVTRYLLLKGERLQRSSAREGGDQQYNLDLKVRLEY